MNKAKDIELSPEDALFLKRLGFIEDIPDEEDIEDGIWTSYYLEMKDHLYINNLQLSVNVEPGFISAYGNDANETFLEKPFTRESLLAIMKFLGFPVTST